MIHLSSLTMLQMVLIEIGLVLELIALRHLFMGPPDYQKQSSDHSREDHRHNLDEKHESEPAQAAPARRIGRGVNPSAQAKIKELCRTSSVKFVQTFKFRECDPHHQ